MLQQLHTGRKRHAFSRSQPAYTQGTHPEQLHALHCHTAQHDGSGLTLCCCYLLLLRTLLLLLATCEQPHPLLLSAAACGCLLMTANDCHVKAAEQSFSASPFTGFSFLSLLHPRQDNELIIVMEWAEAGDLAQLVKQRIEQGQPFTQAEILHLFSQVGCLRLTCGISTAMVVDNH